MTLLVSLNIAAFVNTYLIAFLMLLTIVSLKGLIHASNFVTKATYLNII